MSIFPLPLPSGIYSLRFYETGTASSSFTANQWQFLTPDGLGNQAWSKAIRVVAASGATLSISFDGVNVHGKIDLEIL